MSASSSSSGIASRLLRGLQGLGLRGEGSSQLSDRDADPGLEEVAAGRGEELQAQIEEPEHLTCPIAFTLLRDPVMLINGHTYERNAIMEFWGRRPLANPLGSGGAPPLRSAQMISNFGVRSLVEE